MKRRSVLALCALVIFCALAAPAAPDDQAGQVDALIAVLQSSKSPEEKIEACKQLKALGAAKSVPPLAALLGDGDVSLFAREALEVMPAPEARIALCRALTVTDGTNKAGIIDTLGERGERGSLQALIPLLRDPDENIAASAAAALGKIGGSAAAEALEEMRGEAVGTVRSNVVGALLVAADHFLLNGDRKKASDVYERLYDSNEKDYIRIASYRGLVLSADEPTVLLCDALKGEEDAAQRAALQIVAKTGASKQTRAFAQVLQEVPVQIQPALIDALSNRNDPAATEAVSQAVTSPSEAVRIAALRALATLGGPAQAGLLAKAAADSSGIEQRTARASLVRLKGPEAGKMILSEFQKAEPAVLAELARALGDRQEEQIVPELLSLSMETHKEEIRVAVARALDDLARESDVSAIVGLLCKARSEKERTGFESALSSFIVRSKDKKNCLKPVLVAIPGGEAARCALLRVAGQAGGPDVLQVLRKAVRDDNENVRDTAIRTMAETCGLEAAPDLLALASDAKSLVHRVLALRGYWRLVGMAAHLPLEERWQMCKAGMSAAERAEERRLGCTQLAAIHYIDALELAESLCQDENTRAEAELACLNIAAGIRGSHADSAETVLERLSEKAINEATRLGAQRMLSAMQGQVEFEYIPVWLVAGPYREQGKDCSALFDVVFPPEQPNAGGVIWSPAPSPKDASQAWQVDLAEVVAGNQCVVYIMANVSAPRTQSVRLDIASDDGVKLWINDRLVHTNNAIRGITPDQDTVETELTQGPNEFLLKITQNNMGCAAAVRIRNTDLTPIKGLLCW